MASYDLESPSEKQGTRPPAIVVYGKPGVGKSTFAAGVEKAFYMDIEKGAGYINGITMRKCPETFTDVLGWLDSLLTGKHDYKAIVIDSADWLESLIHKKVCKDSNAKSIADKYNDVTSYGNGHIAALNMMIQVRDKLDLLRDQRGMIVIITAHTLSKSVDDPIDGGHDEHALKLHWRTAAALVEWADTVLMAKKELLESKIDPTGKTQGNTILLTSGRLGATTKNRLNLPPQIPCNWNAFVSSINTNPYTGE